MAEASLTLRRRTGHEHNIAVDLLQLAGFTIDRKQPARASALLGECVPQIRATGSAWLEAALVRAVARLMALQGHWEASVELHAAAATRYHDQGTAPSAEELRVIQADLDAAHSARGAVAHAKAWAAGTALDHASAFHLTVRRLDSPPERINANGA